MAAIKTDPWYINLYSFWLILPFEENISLSLIFVERKAIGKKEEGLPKSFNPSFIIVKQFKM